MKIEQSVARDYPGNINDHSGGFNQSYRPESIEKRNFSAGGTPECDLDHFKITY
jgi:hypothetical protein